MSFTPVHYRVPPPQLNRPPPAPTPAPTPGPSHQHHLHLPTYGSPKQNKHIHLVPQNKLYPSLGPPPPYEAASTMMLHKAPPPAVSVSLPPFHQPPPMMSMPPPNLPSKSSYNPYPPLEFNASRMDPYQQPPAKNYYSSCGSGGYRRNNNSDAAYAIPSYTYVPPPLVTVKPKGQSSYDPYAIPSTSKDYPLTIPEKHKYSSSHPHNGDIDRLKYRHGEYSPGHKRRHSRSPPSREDRERHSSSRHRFEEKLDYERMRHEQERRREYELRRHENRRYEIDKRRSPSRRSPSHRSSPRRSMSRRSPSRHTPPRNTPSRHTPSGHTPSRHSPYRHSSSRRSPSRRSPPYTHRRSPSHRSHASGSRHSRSPSRRSYRSRSRDRHASSSRHREASRSRQENAQPMTDREKILDEYRKNYCRNSRDFIERMEKWSKENDPDNDASPKTWYRSSPATLYYKSLENKCVEQTPKLAVICDMFRKELIERGRKARPEVDELPPLSSGKVKSCQSKMDDEESGSSTSEAEELDDEGLQGYTDRIMQELQRKQNHPRRLHPEMWFNNTGEMNGGPLCRCSARARRHGMRHGVYAGEDKYPKCAPNKNNLDKLYHYRITVSPPTNFLIKSPTIIGHDEHEFLFSGFSMFTHSKLAKLPVCEVIRFNIEYTILYVEEPAPENFSIEELDLFEEFLFYEILELVDLDLGKGTADSCSQFHFMPRFVRYLPDGGCEVLSMCEVMRYLLAESGLLVPPERLQDFHRMDHYSWQKFVDGIKGMIVTYPGKKPCSVRVDQLDRSPPFDPRDPKNKEKLKNFFPEIVHFGVRPPQLSYAGNPEYQKAWRYYVKYRHLIANMSKPTPNERRKLASKESKLQEMRTQSKMKRDVTVAISSQGAYTTGLMCDVVQHAMLIPLLVRHLRFHKSLESLEKRIGYVFKQRSLLQTALTHPSYRQNFGTNPDHARNSLTNCGIRQPEYGDRRIHYTRKKGIVTLINIMSRFGKHNETESAIKHNERLEFLGDAVVEFLSSIHLFKMFPALAEGGLATYRAAIVQNQHLAQLAKNIGLEQYMLYAHGSDLCRDVVMRHAMANCFEALMGALFLDGSIEQENLQVADRVFSLALWHSDPPLREVWSRERVHPLQEQEPLGDRKYIKDYEFLQKLTKFEDSIGVQFKHIRLLARAFTDRSVGYTHLTLGSNQRLEFLGDTVLQLIVSGRLYKHFPEHHEGHLSLLRSSLVNNRTQSLVCDDLDMSSYAIYNNPKTKPTTKKHKADLLEAFLGALFIDKNIEYCEAFCNACLFPRLQEFIMNQDWNDPKSKLQQCCLTLRSMEGGEPDIPFYKVIECLGPTNTRVYTVAVYFRGVRLAAGRGHSIQEAEMNAAEEALNSAYELFPQLDHQKRVIAKSMKHKKHHNERIQSEKSFKKRKLDNKLPRAYRADLPESSDESVHEETGTEAVDEEGGQSHDDSGLDSDSESVAEDKLGDVKVTSLLNDMERLKRDLIKRNKYDQLKEKAQRQADGEDDSDE